MSPSDKVVCILVEYREGRNELYALNSYTGAVYKLGTPHSATDGAEQFCLIAGIALEVIED